MALSINQAQDIVQKLSNEQLMQAYTNGTVPQFVVFSEMQRRQQMQKPQGQMPTETVAEKMVGRDEPQGVPPQMAAKGGMTKASTLTMGSRYLPEDALATLKMRYEQMQDDEKPMEFAEGGEIDAPQPSSGSPLSNKDIARMIMPSLINVESGGNQAAVSKAGARGVAQLMPNTAPEAAKFAGLAWDPDKYRNDSKYNSDLGHAYLAKMLDRFGDREKALAAYNAGPGRLSQALLRAEATGKPWMSFMPKETQAYVPKVLGGAQAQLPARQDPEGPDTPYTYGSDSAFLPSGVRSYYSGYEYPRKPEVTNAEKGLSALLAAEKLKGFRFADGSDGEPVDAELPESYPDYTPMPSLEERLKREALRKKINDAPHSEPRKPSFIERVKGSFKPPVDIATAAFGARDPEQDKDIKVPEILPTQIHGSEYSPLPKREMTDYPRQPDQYNYPKPDRTTGDTYPYERPPQSSEPSAEVPAELRGIASVGGSSPFTGSEPPPGSPEYKQAEAQLAKMQTREPKSGVGGTPVAQDQSFDVVMKQVQDAIGSKIPDELRENMKKHQETIASMKNDKLVDALFAAAKTLAGQRIGQQNFGDAVANAGLAAQEAQKRIYKAEDDMRKYRVDLLRAQDDNNYRAASIAMNRIVQLDHDKKSLSIAAMQAQRAHDTAMRVADRDDQRAKLAQDKLAQTEILARRKEIMTEISKIDDHIRAISPRPDKIEMDPEGSKKRIEEAKANRERLRRELQSIGGSSPSVVTEDPKPILKYNPQTGKVE